MPKPNPTIEIPEPMDETPEVAQTAPERPLKDRLWEAFLARDEAVQAFEPSKAAIDAADREVQRLVHQFVPDQEFDPEVQPVLHKLTEIAKSRSVLAVRLLLQERYAIKLHQNPKAEPQKPPESVGINGVVCEIPRGIKILVPEAFHDILEASEVS